MTFFLCNRLYHPTKAIDQGYKAGVTLSNRQAPCLIRSPALLIDEFNDMFFLRLDGRAFCRMKVVRNH